MTTLHAFEFLAAPDVESHSCYVVFGDEPFLKRLVLNRLWQQLLGQGESPDATFAGPTCEWRDVNDELSTVSLFHTGPRLALVDAADEFVTRYRPQLEDRVAASNPSGVLVLDVTKWAGNTRLYKAIDQTGVQVACRAPEKSGRAKGIDEAALAKWLVGWCKSQHQAKLERAAADELISLTGIEMGLLDQELAKLALFAGENGAITVAMVHSIVGGWRAKTTWELIDAAADGNAAEAISQFDRLLQSGQHPNAIFGQISWSLRRFAAAVRIYEQAQRSGRRMPLQQALEEAGFRKWPRESLQNAERQLKQIGRARASQLYRWLLEIDLSLKGSHSSPTRARTALELLFLRIAKQSA